MATRRLFDGPWAESGDRAYIAGGDIYLTGRIKACCPPPGAFQVAARAGLPVLPVVVRGTRSTLRPDTWLPRRGRVQVQVGPAITPVGTDFGAVVALSRAARAWMLEHSGEPDLE